MPEMPRTIQEGKGMSREMLLIMVQLKCAASSLYIKQPSVRMDLLLGQRAVNKMSHLSI